MRTQKWMIISLAVIFAVIFCLLTTNALAQQAAPQRSPLDPDSWGVVYDIPATKQVKVRKDVPYLRDQRRTLTVDIYSPPDLKSGEKRPAVVFVNAVGDGEGDKVKEWEIYRSWPRLIAAHGMIGISMDADRTRIPESVRGVFDFLTSSGAEFGVDGARLGLYAASANVTRTYEYLISDGVAKGIRAAALYYGGVPAGRIRKDLPIMFIVAQGDAPRAGTNLAALWGRVVEAQAPWSLLYASDLPHAFDGFSDNDQARRIIQQSIAFWKSHLEPVPQPSWQPSLARQVVEAGFWNDQQKMASLLANWIKENPNDVAGYSQYGRVLYQLGRADEAATAYEKALSLGDKTSGVFLGLAIIKSDRGQTEESERFLARAIEAGMPPGDAYAQVGVSLVRKSLPQALEKLREEKKTKPSGQWAQEAMLNQIGNQLVRSQRARDAIEIYRLCFEFYPKSSRATFNLGYAYEVAGDKKLALEFFERCLQLVGEDPNQTDSGRQFINTNVPERIRVLKAGQ